MPRDEMGTVGPPGPYDCDYDPEEVGSRYWKCPECKRMNTLARPKPFEDDT